MLMTYVYLSLCIYANGVMISQSRTLNYKMESSMLPHPHVMSGRLAKWKKTHTVSVEMLLVSLL